MPDPTAERIQLAESAPILAIHLARVRARQNRVALLTGAAMALTALVIWLAIEMPLDWQFEIPLWARALIFIAGLGATGFLLWRFGLRPWLHSPDDDRVALAIERAVPEFRSRFIASVQLARQQDGASGSLVRALLNETAAVAQAASFDGVVKTARLRRWGAISGGLVLAALALWWLGGNASWPLLQRAWLANVPVPRKTAILASTGDRVIALGDDIRLDATAGGVIPARGRLFLKGAGGRGQEFTFDVDPLNPAHFSRTMRSVQESFEYSIQLGDNRSPWHRVRARPRPTITGLECEQRWPAYTGLPPQRRTPGDLKLLAGSKLAVRLKASAALRATALKLVGVDSDKPLTRTALQPDPATPGDWIGQAPIPARDVTGMTFDLVDEEGVESKAMAVHRIEIIPDQPPTIRILWPERREELVTLKATLLIAFEARDDFGVARVRLHYAINWNEGAPHKTLDLDLGGEQPRALTRRFEWRLDRLTPALKEGDVVDFWFEARDANDVTGPGVTILPEHYQARVVSDADKRADLANRLTDTLQGLNDVRQGQEDLARRLGDLIQERPPQP